MRIRIVAGFFVVSLLFVSLAVAAEKGKYKPLFDGKTLKGWTAMPGGTWEVKDGAIVGASQRSERRHGCP